MDLNNKLFTINKKKYLVIDVVTYNSKNYVFLVNKDNEDDMQFKEVINDKNLILKQIESNLFIEKIYPLFVEKFEKY